MLADHLKPGLSAPICLTWELTYGCNLACIHCLSSSGRRDPRELSTEEAKALVDEFAAMQVFYVNIGGGEPLVRPDFFEIVEYAIERRVGVKFSTNGAFVTQEAARRFAATDYLDIQISLDGATPETNDPIRGIGRGFARTESLRGRAGGLSRRPCWRCLCLPVRASRPVQGWKRARRRRL
jgi:[mycofactocin precursor peptide]-tyrosine decarboxylase / 3-amino-5-[(4-hydroxyphenyl)methyl]-4,4-dimethylpyrrolidin-2-one synthase